jgi:DNA-directed RNA polymerase specialized sigma24 family protein
MMAKKTQEEGMGLVANKAAVWMEQGGSAQAESDQTLVERAQQGDIEAFGELIGQHRNKARNWAERMTGDPYLADDVVQDALIRAFLHLGSLADTTRFLPWLHRIVQNQANMRLRRGGPFKRELPFTSWQGDASLNRVEWDNLDSILDHLTCMASKEAVKAKRPGRAASAQGAV